uniref:Arrestin_C domain-containing protein n=1 Tax=Gongylonema pulchrum TaxID=637853 RepID=A0A183EEZ6_9BILA
LPSSFEGEYGFVRYTCTATCERPWDVDIVSKRAFTVVGIEDINQEPETMEPACVSECDSSVSFCCRKQGSVSVKLSLDRTGFTPGEQFQVNATITNDSSKTIRCSALKMRQQVDYRAKTFAGSEHVKSASRVIVKKEKGEIAPHSKFAWINENVVVPSIPPRLSRCKIIQITYTLELDVDGCVKAVLPIQIGTIPCLSNIVERTINGQKKMDSPGAANGATPTQSIPKPVFDGSTIQVKQVWKATNIGQIKEKTDLVKTVEVTVTNESGQTLDNTSDGEDLSPQAEVLLFAKKRVRMPSSILSELYPKLPSPYYR